MIKIVLWDNSFEQDIRPLVKAFYPKEEIKIFLEEIPKKGLQEWKRREREQSESQNYLMLVFHDEEKVEVYFRNKDGEWDKECYQFSSIILSQNRTRYKNQLKAIIYTLLSRQTATVLPWGTLTGIRPVKIAMEKLEAGEKKENIRQYMHKEYLCSEEKASLSIEIAEKEWKLLKRAEYEKGYSIYIGIPFCPTTCLYCSFTSYSIGKYADKVEQYLQALRKEMDYVSKCYKGKKLTTIYIGGGTPTTLSAKQLEGLIEYAYQCFPIENTYEFTVEAGRPDSITRDKLQVLKRQKVTRISINPQTMVQKTLDLIGRRHSVEQVKETFFIAREEGFENINMDLIIGLPGETEKEIAYTLSEIEKLSPDSLTVHALALKRASSLNLMKEKYTQILTNDAKKMQQLVEEYARKNGYFPYYLYRQKNMTGNLENIGYAKLGKEGLYNILIMEEKQSIIAMGAGGASKLLIPEHNRIERVENVKNVEEYINRIDEMIDRKRQVLE